MMIPGLAEESFGFGSANDMFMPGTYSERGRYRYHRVDSEGENKAVRMSVY